MDTYHGYPEWTWSFSLDVDMQHGRGYAAQTQTWACRIDTDMHPGLGHAPWTKKGTMDIDMYHGQWTLTCIIDNEH
jgi:hypothetical protein